MILENNILKNLKIIFNTKTNKRFLRIIEYKDDIPK